MAKQIFCAKNHLFKSATHEDIKYGYRRISFYTIFMDKQGEGLVSYVFIAPFTNTILKNLSR